MFRLPTKLDETLDKISLHSKLFFADKFISLGKTKGKDVSVLIKLTNLR